MRKYLPIVIGLFSLLVFFLSLTYTSFILFFVGVGLILIAIFLYISQQVIDLYKKDKIIDYELVKKQGLTLVHCPECEKENILEDVYCVHCGERLEKNEI